MNEFDDSHSQAKLVELEASVFLDVEHLGSVSLGEKAKTQRISRAIQEKLAQIRALTRDLELLYEELDSEDEQQQVAMLVTQHKAEYERIQQAFKQAVLQQRLRAVQSAAAERKELLAGAADPTAKQRRLVEQGELVSASANVTEGLRRTRQVLTEQLDHTSTTLAAMEQSHAQLGKTKDEYHQQAGQLKTSKGLLGTLNWQQTAERLMLWVGLAIFVLVVAYIVQKRVGYFLPSALSPSALLSSSWGRLTRGGPSPASPMKQPPVHLVPDQSYQAAFQGSAAGGVAAPSLPQHVGEQGWDHAGHAGLAAPAQQQHGIPPHPPAGAGVEGVWQGHGGSEAPPVHPAHAQQAAGQVAGRAAVHPMHVPPQGQAAAEAQLAAGMSQQQADAPQAPPAMHAVHAEAPYAQQGGSIPNEAHAPGDGRGWQWHEQDAAAVHAAPVAPAGHGHVSSPEHPAGDGHAAHVQFQRPGSNSMQMEAQIYHEQQQQQAQQLQQQQAQQLQQQQAQEAGHGQAQPATPPDEL